MKRNFLKALLLLSPLLIVSFANAFSYSEFFNKYTGNIVQNFGGGQNSISNLLSSVKFGNIFRVNTSNSNDSGVLKINTYGNNTLSETIDKYAQSEDKIGLIYSSDGIRKEGSGTFDKLSQLINGDSDLSDTDAQKKLFTKCADSAYGGNIMSSECKQFPDSDYQKYFDSKNSSNVPAAVSTSVGQITPTPSSQSGGGFGGNTLQSDSINNNRTPLTPQEQIAQRNLIEPSTPSNFDISKTNTNAEAKFDGWITGYATLFAINGGANEAGQRMNKTTAFGYNPYDPKTCIASLPYKTIDKFFGTTLDQCIKTKNTSCIGQIKKQVKDRAIEVVMLKNGKQGVFPLGDLGPAEWTGNAIDFTRCAGNILGATGKDLVRFRPAPQGTSITK